jgi:hypothetical protein
MDLCRGLHTYTIEETVLVNEKVDHCFEVEERVEVSG